MQTVLSHKKIITITVAAMLLATVTVATAVQSGQIARSSWGKTFARSSWG